MGVYTVTMKIHSRKDVTADYSGFNPCGECGAPAGKVEYMVSGSKKQHKDTVVYCSNPECENQTFGTVGETVEKWNNHNPIIEKFPEVEKALSALGKKVEVIRKNKFVYITITDFVNKVPNVVEISKILVGSGILERFAVIHKADIDYGKCYLVLKPRS